MADSDMKVTYMWDAKLLEDMDLSEYGLKFENHYTAINPDDGIIFRPLGNTDFEKGFTDVLSQLTKVGTVTKEDFFQRFHAMKACGCYYPIVVEDTKACSGNGKIIGTGTLEIEQKFIHSTALRGRVEEVVIDEEYRGRRFGKIMLGLITALGKKLTCYKITLESKVENMTFYQKFNYKEDPEKFMQVRFRD